MTITITLTRDEKLALAEIRRTGGYLSDEDAVRGALFLFAVHFDVDIPPKAFALEGPARKARKT